MWVVVKIMVPFWGTPNIRCRIIIGIQKRPIILTTTHVTAFCIKRMFHEPSKGSKMAAEESSMVSGDILSSCIWGLLEVEVLTMGMQDP